MSCLKPSNTSNGSSRLEVYAERREEQDLDFAFPTVQISWISINAAPPGERATEVHLSQQVSIWPVAVVTVSLSPFIGDFVFFW